MSMLLSSKPSPGINCEQRVCNKLGFGESLKSTAMERVVALLSTLYKLLLAMIKSLSRFSLHLIVYFMIITIRLKHMRLTATTIRQHFLAINNVKTKQSQWKRIYFFAWACLGKRLENVFSDIIHVYLLHPDVDC